MNNPGYIGEVAARLGGNDQMGNNATGAVTMLGSGKRHQCDGTGLIDDEGCVVQETRDR